MPRVSVCCCSMNARYDTDIFVRALARHNPGFDFEVVITHDDRVRDGSTEQFAELQREFPFVKIVKHTHDDTVDYLRKLMGYYDSQNLWPKEFRAALRENLEKFAVHQLFDPKQSFLWISSGLLYNKAVQASSGDVVIVTPGDFLYLFSLKDAHDFAQERARDGIFYGKPHALFARVTNHERDWLCQYVDQVHRGVGFREGFRWDSTELTRDYLRYPSPLADIFIPDFQANELICLDRDDFTDRMKVFCHNFIRPNAGMQYLPQFHGYHLMTRKAYDIIGGFTEEFFGRAWADDRMTSLGKRICNCDLPSHLAVAWCGQGEVAPYHGPGYQPGWQQRLEAIPYYGEHPIPPSGKPTYLESGIVEPSYLNEMRTRVFNRYAPPLRICT